VRPTWTSPHGAAMSRIRDALSKIEGEVRPLEPEPYAPAPYAAPVYAPEPYANATYVPAPVYDPAPMAPLEAPHPLALEAPTGDALPGIPGDFHRELSGLRFTLETALPDRATRVVQFTAAVGARARRRWRRRSRASWAQDPTQSVLLIDANLRRPGSGSSSACPRARTGASWPARRGRPGVVAVAVERWNLHVLTALPVASEHGQVFQADALRGLLGAARRHYRWVIIDAAPVLDAPETATLARPWTRR